MNTIAYAAVWSFIFTLPWEGVVRVGGTAVLSRVTGAAALAFAICSIVMSGRLRRWHAFHLAAALFLGSVTINQFLFHLSEPLPNKYRTFVLLALVLWIIWEMAPSRSRLLGLLLAYVLGASVAALQTVLLYRREAQALRRFAAGDVDPNDLAMTLALSLPMAWYLGMSHPRLLIRWICRCYIPVGLFAIGLTGSRGGMLATVVALLIVPLSMTRLKPGQLALAISVLCLSGGLAVAYVPDQIVKRLATTSTEVEDLRLGGRFKIWVAGLEAFRTKPFMGYGTSGFIGAVTPLLGRQSLVAHNSYISVLVEQGLIGFTCFLLMFLAVFWSVLGLPPPERRFALVLLATLGVAMLPLTWEDHKQLWFILAALVGISQSRVAPGGAARLRPLRAAPVARGPMAGGPRGPLIAPGHGPDRDTGA